MKLATGIDIIEIARLHGVIERHGGRFLRRVFTLQELEDCAGRAESLAARFAAKEAAAKALGCGIGAIAWQEIEIRHDENGRPTLHLHGAAARLADEQGLSAWSISLSHSRSHAVAMVVAM
ncbi:MAG: holo-ACP synthase [Chloroflexi bacterium]|nr:holo-ACP synthase [Chloroflexota bacterium]